MIEKLDGKTLREHKGKSFVGVATAVAIFNQKGEVLMAKRSENCRDEHGRWDICGGGLKLGETIDSNMRREMKEELDLTSDSQLEPIGIWQAFRKDGEDDTHWISIDHIIVVGDKEAESIKINEPENFSNIGWFNLDSLPSPLHSQLNKERLRRFKLKLRDVF